MSYGRLCRVPGCDSSGNTDGVSESHFLPACCPKNMGLTLTQCKDISDRLTRRGVDVNRMLTDPVLNERSERTLRCRSKIFKRERWSPDGDCRPKVATFYKQSICNELKVKTAKIFSKEAENINGQVNGGLRKDIQALIYNDYMIVAPTSKHDTVEMQQSVALYFCDRCLLNFPDTIQMRGHAVKCGASGPPGTIIYRHHGKPNSSNNATEKSGRRRELVIFEIDGVRYLRYCQNVCILARRFLNHKTAYENVGPFMFYVLACSIRQRNALASGDKRRRRRSDIHKYKMLGYFSKLKADDQGHNLSCLVVLPPFMGRGYGTLLIDCSYKMSTIEGKIGSPERPFTDFGLTAYRKYWSTKLFMYMKTLKDEQSFLLQNIANILGIHLNDIVETLQYHRLVKSFKGKHIILKDWSVVEEYLKGKTDKERRRCHVDVRYLTWKPKSSSQPKPCE